MVPEGGCSDREQAWWGQGGSQLGMLRNEVQHSGRHGGQPAREAEPFERDIAGCAEPPLCRAPRLDEVAHSTAQDRSLRILDPGQDVAVPREGHRELASSEAACIEGNDVDAEGAQPSDALGICLSAVAVAGHQERPRRRSPRAAPAPGRKEGVDGSALPGVESSRGGARGLRLACGRAGLDFEGLRLDQRQLPGGATPERLEIPGGRNGKP